MKIIRSIAALLTTAVVSLSAFAMPAAAAELPSGTSYDDIGQKIEALFSEHESTAAGLATAVSTRTVRSIRAISVTPTRKTRSLWTRTPSLNGEASPSRPSG